MGRAPANAGATPTAPRSIHWLFRRRQASCSSGFLRGPGAWSRGRRGTLFGPEGVSPRTREESFGTPFLAAP
jgi:hypothetical protein